MEELDRIITRLMEAGVIFEEEPLKYRRIQVTSIKPSRGRERRRPNQKRKRQKKLHFWI